MVEAIRSVQQTQLRASMSMAVRVLARQRAIKAVKQALAAKGLKPQYIAKREIVAAAEEYLAAHPELNAEAKETVEEWQAEGMFRVRGRAKLRTFTPIANARGPCTYIVRNSCAKGTTK